MILAGDYIPKDCSVRLELPPEEAILCNLEAPILGNAELPRSPKSGPNLRNRSLGNEFKNFRFALANNHMMDFGDAGLKLTRKYLAERHIPFCGAGDDLEQARRPMILEESGKKIAVFSCCERQFGGADRDRAGVAVKGLWLFDAIKAVREKVDFIIVSCHIGLESSPFPAPSLREFYQQLIVHGADIVHGHHSHIPQGVETFGNGVIFYGLGNFAVVPEDWNYVENHCWSLLAQFDFSTPRPRYRIRYAVVEGGTSKQLRVRLAAGTEIVRYAEYLRNANQALRNAQSCDACWQEVCVQHFDRLYGISLHFPAVVPVKLSWRNRIRYSIDMLSDFFAVLTGRKFRSCRTVARSRIFLNFFQCESHVDAVSTAAGVLSGEYPDRRDASSAAAARVCLAERRSDTIAEAEIR